MKTLEIQWRCNCKHPDCEAEDWKHYKHMPENEAKAFMVEKAPNSRNFEYRIKPSDE